MSVEELLGHLREGDLRALARALTWIESGDPRGQELLRRIPGTHRSKVVGITGSPGAGKSTLTDQLIGEARSRGERVGVLAIDPSSPFSGGAILGDRIRMMRHHRDPGVFIRSLASRGALGGLAGAAVGALALLEAFGFDVVFIETVGIGQSEVDIARVADTTVLVLTPAAGDAVQAFKAGIMEIADLFVINKFDLPGGETLIREIKSSLELAPPRAWKPPILRVVATQAQGISEVYDALQEHREYLEKLGTLDERRLERARFELESLIQEWGRRKSEEATELVAQVAAGQLSPEQAARQLLRELSKQLD
jgi:LAO/AO transport system kinase